MALEQEEFRRRLVAAREVIGCDQAAMGQRLKAAGLGSSDAMRLERGTLEFSDSHEAAYVKITGLPAIWFEAADYTQLVRESLEAVAAELPATRAQIENLDLAQTEGFARVRTELAAVRRSLGLDEAQGQQ